MSRLATPLRKNDNVLVIVGKDRGKRGRILKVLPDKNRLVVEGDARAAFGVVVQAHHAGAELGECEPVASASRAQQSIESHPPRHLAWRGRRCSGLYLNRARCESCRRTRVARLALHPRQEFQAGAVHILPKQREGCVRGFECEGRPESDQSAMYAPWKLREGVERGDEAGLQRVSVYVADQADQIVVSVGP